MKFLEKLRAYQPFNEQEMRDKDVMLRYFSEHEDCLERKNQIAHVTVSTWTVNADCTKALMAYHNIYNAWAWSGGHADGDDDLPGVALRELREETGARKARLLSDDIFSIEILTVDGHVKKGEYVPSHLHLNITYLAQVDEREALAAKPDENSGVQWFCFSDIEQMDAEPWMTERIYRKLISKCRLKLN